MPTLAAYRAYVAKELGGFHSSTSSGTSTTVALIDLAWPIKSTISQEDYWADYYILRPNAVLASDRVRLVKTYAPATGALVPDTAWTNPPGNAEAYELHGVLEPDTAMRDAINEGLKRTMIKSEIVGAAVSEKMRHSLGTIAPWLSDPLWVRQVGWLSANDDRNEIDPYGRSVRGQAVEDNDGVAIDHPGFTLSGPNPLTGLGADTFYIRIIKRAYDHCRPTAGAFGAQSGLLLDSDEAPVNLEWLGAAALIEIWRRNSQVMETASRMRQIPNLQDAAARFTYLTHLNFIPWPLTLTPWVGGGPRHGRRVY